MREYEMLSPKRDNHGDLKEGFIFLEVTKSGEGRES